ncbi:sugar/nucleoside kinase (ribokinase family) [Ruminiclostridium sufflavum DSM 19573]|uniref:Sugar/nucleoside kinase (Ribokinase family) n=1 Tax=Ruminiclostridium sufflavum DSM 19573 TaxID=1121337 RepID=A0A318XMM8_9FIRM|nr:sugar kinase [Ruminiclostridium sufflavum]PYG88006.1 sugar/nucleoside kinase (ribokinase family) [Ruminiclostridium sufflavum DSM 19573]
MKVLCVGMMVCDIPLHPVPGNILKLDSWKIDNPVPTTGGDALNVAIGLARLGLEVSLCGRIGQDINGEFIMDCAKKEGVEVSAVVRDTEYPTAASYILIDTLRERHFLASNKIFNRLAVEDIPQESIQEADIVYFGSALIMDLMDNGGIEKLFSKAHSLGKITAMDAAINSNGQKDYFNILNGALNKTDYFLPSYDEAKILTGEEQPERMAEKLRRPDMKALVIKLGKRGCYVTDFIKGSYISTIENMPVKDTTGAGDSFVAGFLCGISNGWDIYKSAAFGNTIASINVGAVGATAGIPDFKSALAFFEMQNIQY